MSNEIVTEGLQYILETAFSEEQSVPANFYVGLCTDAAIDESDGLSDLTELSGNGYSRQTVASDNADLTSAAESNGNWSVTTKQVTFTASGGAWDGAVHAFIATTTDDSGKLIAATELSTTRTLQDGDSLNVTIVLELNG